MEYLLPISYVIILFFSIVLIIKGVRESDGYGLWTGILVFACMVSALTLTGRIYFAPEPIQIVEKICLYE